MLLRQLPTRATLLFGTALRPSSRPFTTTPPRRDDVTSHSPPTDHYETLQISRDATPAQIKKSFYALSKKHHPDANPHDTTASKRFVRISEAYTVLSTPAKRAAYDRTLPSRHHHHHRGSYHSTGPAGGRPASGLSQRRPRTTAQRGTFRGPSPSFYAHGGYGAHGEKRRTAHEESTGGWASGRRGEPRAAEHGEPPKEAGMGHGQDPFGNTGDLPHFDRHAHERTHRRADERRARRAAARELEDSNNEMVSPVVFFVGVVGVLMAAIAIPMVLVSNRDPHLYKPSSKRSGSNQ